MALRLAEGQHHICRGARMAEIRPVFYVSDGTGITAETVGHSLLTQFTGFSFVTDRMSFVDDADKAHDAAARIKAAGEHYKVRPIVVSSCVDSSLGLILEDRKSTRLNSSHVKISYAVFCLKKKKKNVY